MRNWFHDLQETIVEIGVDTYWEFKREILVLEQQTAVEKIAVQSTNVIDAYYHLLVYRTIWNSICLMFKIGRLSGLMKAYWNVELETKKE